MADENATATDLESAIKANEADPSETAQPEDWSPPEPREDGVEVDGHGLPFNHRLRAEELSDAGKDSDPGGIVTAEQIADATARLEADRKARPPLRSNMSVKDLERIAKNENVDISAATNNADRIALIEAARTGIVAPPAQIEENA